MISSEFKSLLVQRWIHHNKLVQISTGTSLLGQKVSRKFPYEVDTNKPAIVQAGGWSKTVHLIPSVKTGEIRYLLMMPVVLPESQEKLEALVEKFFGEACYTDEEKKQVSLVIGVNVRRGLDSRQINRLYELILNYKRSRFSVSLLAFSWDPHYHCNDLKWQYDVYKTYRIFHLIDPVKAESLRQSVENLRIAVPYINIREFILKSATVFKIYTVFQNGKMYLGILDPDACHFNGVIHGANSEIEAFQTKQKTLPQIFSPGYKASKEEAEVIQIGLEIDRAIRTETNLVMGGGSYFTEVFFLFGLNKSPQEVTFLTKETRSIQSYESRRIMQNYLFVEGNNRNLMAHGGSFPIVTTIMERMKTRYTRKKLRMTQDNLYSLEALKCMCGLTYSHLDPRQWAQNLYASLPLKASNIYAVIVPMEEIYKVVHPIYTAYTFLGYQFTPDEFENWLINFTAYLSCINEYWVDDHQALMMMDLEGTIGDLQSYQEILNSQYQALHLNWEKLTEQGLDREWINSIYVAAFNSGLKARNLLIKEKR